MPHGKLLRLRQQLTARTPCCRIGDKDMDIVGGRTGPIQPAVVALQQDDGARHSAIRIVRQHIEIAQFPLLLIVCFGIFVQVVRIIPLVDVSLVHPAHPLFKQGEYGVDLTGRRGTKYVGHERPLLLLFLFIKRPSSAGWPFYTMSYSARRSSIW